MLRLFVGPTGVYLLDFFCSGIQFNLLLSPYPCFISFSPVENKNDLELDFKVFFFTDSCCSDIVLDESN